MHLGLSDENVFGYFKTFFLNLQSPYFFLAKFQMKETGRNKTKWPQYQRKSFQPFSC